MEAETCDPSEPSLSFVCGILESVNAYPERTCEVCNVSLDMRKEGINNEPKELNCK